MAHFVSPPPPPPPPLTTDCETCEYSISFSAEEPPDYKEAERFPVSTPSHPHHPHTHTPSHTHTHHPHTLTHTHLPHTHTHTHTPHPHTLPPSQTAARKPLPLIIPIRPTLHRMMGSTRVDHSLSRQQHTDTELQGGCGHYQSCLHACNSPLEGATKLKFAPFCCS